MSHAEATSSAASLSSNAWSQDAEIELRYHISKSVALADFPDSEERFQTECHIYRYLARNPVVVIAALQAFTGASSAKSTQRPKVFVDMDGVVADFDKLRNTLQLSGEQIKQMPGAFSQLEPVTGAIAGIRALIGRGYDVWIASKPPTGIPQAYADKAQWILMHLPELKRKIILTHDKGLLGTTLDFLIDDRPHKANCQSFPGTLIPFTHGATWARVLEQLPLVHLPRGRAAEARDTTNVGADSDAMEGSR